MILMMRRNLSLPADRQSRALSLPASRTRASSIAPQGEQRLTQRDFKSKAVISRAISNLIEFLELSEYPNPISPRLLQSPSTKEVFCIFEHLVRQIVFCFRLERQGCKVEEVCLNILRQLGYPITLSKQYWSTPAAPHAWPMVLAALDWLREEALDSRKLCEDEQLFKYDDNQDGDEKPVGKLLHDLHLEAFSLWTHSSNVPEERLQGFETELRRLIGCPEPQEMEHAQKEITDLQNELAKVDDLDSRRSQLNEQLAEVKTSLASRVEAVSRLKNEVRPLENKDSELNAIESERVANNLKLKKQIAASKQCIKDREAAGFGRLVQEHRMLQERCDSRMQAKTELQREVEQLELACSRREGQVAPVLDAYNRLVGALKAPKNESLASACNLKLRPYNTRFTDLPEVLSDANQCFSNIQSLVVASEQKIEQVKRDLQDLHAEVENLGLPLIRNQLAESEEESNKLDQLLLAADREHEELEKQLALERQSCMTDYNDVRAHVAQVRDELAKMESTFTEQSQWVEERTKFIEELESKGTVFVRHYQKFVEHLNATEQVHSSLERCIRQRIESFNKRVDQKVADALKDSHLWLS